MTAKLTEADIRRVVGDYQGKLNWACDAINQGRFQEAIDLLVGMDATATKERLLKKAELSLRLDK